MTDPMDHELARLAIAEGRRTLDNQFQLFQERSSAAIDLVKLNFIIASILLAAVEIGGNIVRTELVWGIVPLLLSAFIALCAYADSMNRDSYYGITFDMESLRGVDYEPTPIAEKYEKMADMNEPSLERETRLILVSIGLLFASLSFIFVGFIAGFI